MFCKIKVCQNLTIAIFFVTLWQFYLILGFAAFATTWWCFLSIIRKINVPVKRLTVVTDVCNSSIVFFFFQITKAHGKLVYHTNVAHCYSKLCTISSNVVFYRGILFVSVNGSYNRTKHQNLHLKPGESKNKKKPTANSDVTQFIQYFCL